MEPTREARVAAVVPAFQAEKHLRDVLAGVLRHLPAASVFVVDDGSSDATGAIANASGVQVVRHAENRGKGAALVSGFEAARRAGFTHVVTLDADGQHPPACIPDFLAALPHADIVIGSRMHAAESMPRERRLSNRATAAILSALAGQTIQDGQSGYRLLRLESVGALRFASRGFMLESELLVKAARRGARIGHVPIPCVYGDETSHIHAARDTLRFLWLVVRSFFW